MKVYTGQCHSDAIGFRFATDMAPSDWSVRACQCSFCRAHGAACVSDPSGRAAFVLTEEGELQRYRFALCTADFLVCRRCGVYLGAVLGDGAGLFATLNTHAMASVYDLLPAPLAVDYAGESPEQRRHRRKARWTPVA